MSKIQSLSKIHHEMQTSFIKTLQKNREHAFPPILRVSLSKEDNYLKSLMNTERLCLSKIVHPALKEIDCSKIENLRYPENMSSKDNQKTLARPWAANGRKSVKQNKPVLRKLSALEQPQTIRFRRSSLIETATSKTANLSHFAIEKPRQETETQHLKEHNACVTDRESRVGLRDKMNSCKVATKKAGFPFSKKQYQSLKLSEQFDNEEQKLSIIPVQVEQQKEDFMSFETYNELIVF